MKNFETALSPELISQVKILPHIYKFTEKYTLYMFGSYEEVFPVYNQIKTMRNELWENRARTAAPFYFALRQLHYKSRKELSPVWALYTRGY